jgi:hypothetical protein
MRVGKKTKFQHSISLSHKKNNDKFVNSHKNLIQFL